MAICAPRITLSAVITLPLIVVSAISACSPVAEGETATLTCNLTIAEDLCNDKSGNILAWSVSTDQNLQIYCSHSGCTSHSESVNAIIAGSGYNFTSVLTLSSVSRSSDLNMEGRWDCQNLCNNEIVTVCPKLEVFALPKNLECSASEVLDNDGEIQSVFVSCSSTKVYPQADCLFYQSVNEGQPFRISNTVRAMSFPNLESPVYYNSRCNLWIPVSYLGEGLHRFEGRMFPRVNGGDSLPRVVNVPASGPSVYLAFASADHGCSATYSNGYFKGKSVTCTCHLASEGRPKSTAQWYKNDLELSGTETLTLSHNDTELIEAEYACRAKSGLGVSQETGFTPRFAFLDESSMTMEAFEMIADLCDKTNKNNNVTITCIVPKESVHPTVYISFSVDGISFDEPEEGLLSSDEKSLQRKYSFIPEEGKNYQVMCRAQNSIFPDIMHESEADLGRLILFYETPSESPEMMILNKIYQGTDPENQIVINGSVTDVVCHVKGGNPQVHTTDLNCGLPRVSQAGNMATLTVSSVDDTTCVCTAYHASGCYRERTVATLTFSSATQTESAISDDHGKSVEEWIIFTVLACVVVVMVVFVIFVIRHRSSGKSHRDQLPRQPHMRGPDASAEQEKMVYFIPTDTDSGHWSLATTTHPTDTSKTMKEVDSVSDITSVYSDTVSTTSETK